MLDERTDERLLADARRYYDERLKSSLEPARNGEFVAIDIEMPGYAVSTDPVEAYDELTRRGGHGPFVLLRVGSDWTYEMLTSL
jgi:hypothetical protein